MSTSAWWLSRYDDEPERLLGQRIRAVRDAKGLSQEAFAAKLRGLGFPTMRQSSLAKIERGERGVTLSEALAVAELLGTDLRTLLKPESQVKREALAGLRRALAAQEHGAMVAEQKAAEAKREAENATRQLAELRERLAQSVADAGQDGDRG